MKLTRKSYNRRIYTFGILAFLAVALISTGFAAWVMSTNATNEETGSAHVGVITDGQLSFVKNNDNKVVTFLDKDGQNKIDNQFRFDADPTDEEGEIKASKAIDAVYEKLSVEFSVTITPKDYLEGLRIRLVLPDSYFAAETAGYITLPDCAVSSLDLDDSVPDGIMITPVVNGDTYNVQANKTLVNDTVSSSVQEGSENITIKYKMAFTWGEAFDGVNPGFYLDDYTDESNNPYTYEEKVSEFAKFKRTIHGLGNVTDNVALKYAPQTSDQYKLLLLAESK